MYSLAAQSLSTTAAIFPEEANSTSAPVNVCKEFSYGQGLKVTESILQDAVAFHLALEDTVQTLSTNGSPDTGPIKGLLFVPDLHPRDPCSNTTAHFVPPNATHNGDASQFSDNTIALAPWVSPGCTQSFLIASREAHTEALVFYHPSSNDASKPPPPDDPAWTLDGNGGWKSQTSYPVYAIPGLAGTTLMHQLSVYSRNSSNSTAKVPAAQHGQVKLYAEIDLSKAAPSRYTA
jgi:hypothetical protein